jgi:DNA-binding NtrC family response regulator
MTPGRILVVDDESLVRWSLAERLKAEGHQVAEAGTVAEALEHASRGLDLALLDIRLPDGSGLDVLRQLRDLDPDTIVLMLTIQKDVDSIVGAMKGGAFDYVAKPFDLEDVALRVERALEATRMRRELRILRASVART